MPTTQVSCWVLLFSLHACHHFFFAKARNESQDSLTPPQIQFKMASAQLPAGVYEVVFCTNIVVATISHRPHLQHQPLCTNTQKDEISSRTHGWHLTQTNKICNRPSSAATLKVNGCTKQGLKKRANWEVEQHRLSAKKN